MSDDGAHFVNPDGDVSDYGQWYVAISYGRIFTFHPNKFGGFALHGPMAASMRGMWTVTVASATTSVCFEISAGYFYTNKNSSFALRTVLTTTMCTTFSRVATASASTAIGVSDVPMEEQVNSPGTLNFDGYAAFRIVPEGYLSDLMVTYSYG